MFAGLLAGLSVLVTPMDEGTIAALRATPAAQLHTFSTGRLLQDYGRKRRGYESQARLIAKLRETPDPRFEKRLPEWERDQVELRAELDKYERVLGPLRLLAEK